MQVTDEKMNPYITVVANLYLEYETDIAGKH